MEIIINYTLFIFLVLAIITLTFSFNNVILLFNFLSIIFIFSFSLLVFNYILITLLIFIIYSSLLSILFLVNGLLVINSLSFKNYINFRLLINYVCWAKCIKCSASFIQCSTLNKLFIINVNNEGIKESNI